MQPTLQYALEVSFPSLKILIYFALRIYQFHNYLLDSSMLFPTSCIGGPHELSLRRLLHAVEGGKRGGSLFFARGTLLVSRELVCGSSFALLVNRHIRGHFLVKYGLYPGKHHLRFYS